MKFKNKGKQNYSLLWNKKKPKHFCIGFKIHQLSIFISLASEFNSLISFKSKLASSIVS